MQPRLGKKATKWSQLPLYTQSGVSISEITDLLWKLFQINNYIVTKILQAVFII